jgi:hypothetical protein
LYTIPTVPSEAAWMFHVIQVVLVIVGFNTKVKCPSKANKSPMTAESEGAAAQLQVTFFLNGMLATFCGRMKAGKAVYLDYPE